MALLRFAENDSKERVQKTLLILIESHYVFDGEGGAWTQSSADGGFYERYLKVFDHLVVCARGRSASPEVDFSLYRRIDCDRIEFVELPDFQGVKGILLNYFKVRRIVSEAVTRCDCVIFRAPSPLATICRSLLEKGSKPFAAEVVVNPRTAYSKESINSFFQPIVQMGSIRQLKSICAKANGVSYVTEKALQEEYPCRALASGDSKRYFTSSYSSVELNEQDYCEPRGICDGLPISLIHVGTMGDSRKGQAIFLDTVKKLVDDGIDCRATLVGEGPMRCEFERQCVESGISDRVDFLGWVNQRDDLRRLLRESTFLVLPSFSEGLPRCMIEAMANGTLCLGSDRDGIPELVGEKCLSRNNSADEYAGMIEWFLEHPYDARTEAMSQFAISKKYSKEKLEIKRTNFYQKLKDAAEHE